MIVARGGWVWCSEMLSGDGLRGRVEGRREGEREGGFGWE